MISHKLFDDNRQRKKNGRKTIIPLLLTRTVSNDVDISPVVVSVAAYGTRSRKYPAARRTVRVINPYGRWKTATSGGMSCSADDERTKFRFTREYYENVANTSVETRKNSNPKIRRDTRVCKRIVRRGNRHGRLRFVDNRSGQSGLKRPRMEPTRVRLGAKRAGCSRDI